MQYAFRCKFLNRKNHARLKKVLEQDTRIQGNKNKAKQSRWNLFF